MKTRTKLLTATLIAAGLVTGVGVVPAYAAPANPKAVAVSAWPAYMTTTSPKILTAPWYHNGRKVTVTTSKCASGVADQGTFYRWTRISGAYVPLWSAPVHLMKCR